MKERKKEYLRCVLAPLRCPLPYRLDVIYISFSTRKDCIEIFRYRSACLLENLADLVSYCQTLIVNNILIAFSPSHIQAATLYEPLSLTAGYTILCTSRMGYTQHNTCMHRPIKSCISTLNLCCSPTCYQSCAVATERMSVQLVFFLIFILFWNFFLFIQNLLTNTLRDKCKIERFIFCFECNSKLQNVF